MENEIFESLFKIVNFLNDPRNDEQLLRKAGLKNDQNLLPIIVRVGMQPKINVGQLADQLGKTHSSTSRQIDKFVAQGLINAKYNETDKRIREVELSAEGQRVVALINNARSTMMQQVLNEFSPAEMIEIDGVLKKIAQMMAHVHD
ncbi:MarR family transcriptional regulator [Periweissella cryptocerci]|uniref:MarR family transcriptional regulator n=1 Tax=Periweissella cryptocerci TaxID=2506420 RepID=A0A4V1AIH7_9LACO|nr:MarR family transcriptional regulator [Periweissella cryptocerci]QBO35545.1 MarR family transcriptional regulator [Periweissella cryptocerci]